MDVPYIRAESQSAPFERQITSRNYYVCATLRDHDPLGYLHRDHQKSNPAIYYISLSGPLSEY